MDGTVAFHHRPDSEPLPPQILGKLCRRDQKTIWQRDGLVLGTMLPPEALKDFLLAATRDAGISAPDERWAGTDLLTGRLYQTGDELDLSDWGVIVIKEET